MSGFTHTYPEMQAFFFDYIFEDVGGQVFQQSKGIPIDFVF
jgi:hypothetical protein